MEDQSSKKRIVVLGAGFGGLAFCEKWKLPHVKITVVDRQNHHLFQPLLYQVATAGLAGPNIAQPIRSILRDRSNITVLMDEVVDFDLEHHKVMLKTQDLEYDYLVIALGGATSYFGHPEWEKFAPGLKSLADAMQIRQLILLAFEKAELTQDPQERQRLMTIVIAGGGPTGVELAGAIAELARNVLQRDFRHIDPALAKVILVEGEDRLLAHLPADLSESAKQQLEKRGVEIRLKTKVTSINENEVVIGNDLISAATKIWTAGVGAVPITKKLKVECDRAGRVKVNPDLTLPNHPEVFAIGDLALVLDEKGQPVPGGSPAAMQMGQYVAQVIQDEIKEGKTLPRDPFHYWDKGTMATIGRSAAVAVVGRFKFTGYLAWLAWLGVHLIFLVGFRNKISVLFQWIYSYLTYKRGARVIVKENKN